MDFYYGSYPTVRAICILLDGKPAGFIGLKKEGWYMGYFSEYSEALEPYLKTIPVLRAVKASIDLVKKERLPVLAKTDNTALLERLGFSHYVTLDDGEVYRWN